jgi:hypothetical protein
MFKLVEISLKVGIVYTSFITILYHKIIIVFQWLKGINGPNQVDASCANHITCFVIGFDGTVLKAVLY